MGKISYVTYISLVEISNVMKFTGIYIKTKVILLIRIQNNYIFNYFFYNIALFL